MDNIKTLFYFFHVILRTYVKFFELKVVYVKMFVFGQTLFETVGKLRIMLYGVCWIRDYL